MEITFQQLFTSYFPQVTLIIGAVVSLPLYFIKRYFDLKTKKIEVRYALFQQNKIDSIKNYFTAYSTLERIFTKISTLKLVQGLYSTDELDVMTIKGIDNIISANLFLALFMDDSEMKAFQTITNNIMEVHGAFMDAYFKPRANDTVIVRSNELESKIRKMKESNNSILKSMNFGIKHSFLK